MLGRLGIRAIFYLDVILVLGSSYQFCLQHAGVSLHSDEGGIPHRLGEVQPHPYGHLPLLEDALGFGGGGGARPS